MYAALSPYKYFLLVTTTGYGLIALSLASGVSIYPIHHPACATLLHRDIHIKVLAFCSFGLFGDRSMIHGPCQSF